MINNYRSDGWTVGNTTKMTEKISENRQLYNAVDSDDVVNKVKQILKDYFHRAAAMQVMELDIS